MSDIVSFVQQHLEWLVTLSLLTFVGLLILVPAVVINLPADYFHFDKRHPVKSRHPLIKLIVSLIKNLLGAALVIAGLIMLLTPGQGLLTLLVGLMIMNYPGKFKLERWMVTQLHLLPAINWLRARYQKPAMELPSPSHKTK